MPRHTDRTSPLSRVTKPQTITRWVPRPLEQLEDRLTPSTTLSNTPAWIDVGPYNVTGGQTTNVADSPTNSSVTGAVQAVTPDLTDFSGNTLYAGGVNGGVWRTTNALSASPNWVSLTDDYPSLSISTLAINPDNNQQILAGIGGTADGTYSIDPNTGARVVLDSRNVAGGVFGTTRGDLIGALYSPDGGATWKILSDKIGGQNVVGVAVRGTTTANSYLLVATDQGLYRSTNAGTTFTKISGTGILPATGVFDLAADPGAPTSVINSATWNAGVATITTGTPHALSIGQSVIVTGVNPTGYNGTFNVTSVTANTFTYNVAINPGVYFSGGTATANPNADPLARNRFYIAMKSVAGTTTGVGGIGVFRSDDGGQTWGTASVTSPLMQIGAKTTNVQISVFNSGIITNNIVYVAVQNNNPVGTEAGLTGNDYAWANRLSQVSAICWSPNQGGTWTRMDAPRTQTPSQRADVRNDAAGLVTVFTGIRHHLRTGDQVVMQNVFDNGDRGANPPVPSRLIPSINGVRYITVTSENTFTLNNTTFTGVPYDFLHVNQDLALPIVNLNGSWSQILGAAAGERPEFFDLTADRTSSNAVYLGTDRTAASAPGRGHFYPNGSQGPTTFTSTIWKGDRLVNPTGFGNNAVNSAQWSNLTNRGTTNGSAPAADVRDLVMGANGQLIVATGGGLFIMPTPNAASTAVVGASWAAGVATINTSLPHNLLVGQSVIVNSIASAILNPPGSATGYNGTFTVLTATPTSFTYALVANPGQFVGITSSGAGVATVQMLSPHGFAVGNTVQILGVVPGGYNGTFTITSTPGATATSAPDVISNATWAAGVATITTSLLHGVQVGQTVNITGVSVAGYNGSYAVTSVNAALNQYTYALATYPGNAGPGGSQTNAADAIFSAVWASNVATITTTGTHNIVVGQTVTVAGVNITGYNVTAVVTGILSPTRFTYNLAVNPGGVGTGGNATTAANPITSATWNSGGGGVATITTTDPTGVGIGDTVTISGVAINGYNGSFVVTAISGANQFSYALANDPANATGGLGTPVNTDVSIVTATWAAGVATVTTTVNSNRSVGERVVIAGILSVGPGDFNGTFVVTSVSGNSFTYARAVDPGATTRTLPTSFTYDFAGVLPSATTSSSATVTAATVPGGSTWFTLNGNLALAHIFSVAYDSQSGRFFAGTIDTQAISENTVGGIAYGSIFSSGNLRDSFFDQANVFRVVVDNSRLSNAGFPDALTKRYYVGTNFSNILAHTVDAADLVTDQRFLTFASPLTTTTSFSGLNFADRQLINANETVRIAMSLNQNDPRRAIFGYNGLYEDADPSGSTPTGSIVNNVTPPGMTGTVESLLYGGKRAGVNFNQIVYMTTTTGQLWVRGEFGPVFSNITAALTAASGQTGSIYSVVGDPDDYRHIFVAQGGKILESKDFGVTFVDISDNLIGPPTADGTAGPGKLTTEIRTLAIFDSISGVSAPGDLTLVAGGRGGVYRLQTTTVNNGGSWTEYGQALPNTVVNDLQLYNNKVLVAGTAGRGIWTIPDVSTTIDQEAVLIVTGTAAADIITVSVDPNNSNIILVFDGTVTTEWTRGSFSALEVNGLGGADQIIIASTIDRVTHVPIAGGTVDFVNFKITVDGGGDAGDTLRIINEGVTTARQVSITNTTVGNGIGDTIFNGSGQILYTGLGLGTIDISTGAGDDNYILTSLMPGQTILRGGNGSETYNVTMDPASTSVLTILETGTTGTDAINITGTAAADNFTSSPAQVLLGTSAVNYAGIETLAVFGNNGDDTFNINGAGGTVSNTFDGQGGSDTYIIPLDPTTPKTYIVSDTGAAGTDALNITGTAGQNTFNITSAQVLLGLGIVNYSGIERLNIDGLASDDTYNIAQDPASSTVIDITDVSPFNFLNVTGTAAADVFSITNTGQNSQIGLGASVIKYVNSTLFAANVFGGLGNDTFNIDVLFSINSGLHVDGGTGNDTYNVALHVGFANTSVADSGIGGIDVLNVTGTSGDDSIRFTADSFDDRIYIGFDFQNVSFTSSIEAVQVSGGAGNDTFAVTTQGLNTSTAITINGGTGSDILSVGGTTADENVGLDITSAIGDGSFTGLRRSLNFTDIQTLGFDGGLGNDSLTWRDRTNTAYGTAINPDSGIIYTPTDSNSGSLRVGDGSAFPSLQFRNVTASFIVNGDPTGSNTRDVFTVLGVSTTGLQSAGETTSADGSDTFVITDRSVTLTNAALGVMRRVDFAAAVGSSGSPTFSSILVKGGNEAVNGDRFTATPSRLANIVIDGMNPTAGAAADQLTFVSNGSTNTFFTSDTKFGAPQTRILQTVDGSGLGFINIENVTVFDPNRGGEPPLINVTGLTRTNEGAPYTLNLGAVTDPGRVVTSYIVHWGDGSSDTYGTNGGKLHSYADGANTHSITVDIVDQFGLHSNVANPVTNVITVTNVAPLIAVAPGAAVVVGLASSVMLGTVTDPGQDTVSSYVVRWGDGTTDTFSTGGVKAHTYAVAGSYAITVDLVDEDGSYANRGGTTVSVLTPQVNDPNKLNLTVAGVGPDVLVYNTDGTTRFGFRPYEGYTGNITVASGDITGDGIDDIVTGVESQISHVKVFDGATGIEIASFLAYEGFKGGVTVAVGDVLGTGRAQIITGAGSGGGPHVKVFSIAGGSATEVQSFFAYDGGYLGGVTVGAGRLDGSGHEMIVTGARTGSSHVKAFDVATGAPVETRSFFGFDAGFAGGVNVAAGNGSIAVGAGGSSNGHIKVFNYADLGTEQSFFAFPTFEGGARVAFGSRAGTPTLVAGTGSTAPPRFKVFRLADLAVVDNFFIGNVAFDGGIYVG